nr:anti-phage dCTP deaminase [Pelagibacterium xiamenense]
MYPEIFVGLVAPVGVDTTDVRKSLTSEFQAKGYTPIHVKVTDVFPILHLQVGGRHPITSTGYIDRVQNYIKFGDELRERFERNEILAAAAIFSIARLRTQHYEELSNEEKHQTYERRVFIIDQCKRPEEIDLLRKVYGNLFFQISVYARRETRARFIASKVTKDLAVTDGKTADSMALELIADDENEATKPHGQRVGKTFHGADFIVNTEVVNLSIGMQIRRFCELLFGSNAISPTRLEYGMYSAKVAALRTLDLSRQVGAAIFTEAGEVLAMGSNEVPKGGGGTYWSDSEGIDAREYRLEIDTNDDLKKTVAREFYTLVKGKTPSEAEFGSFLDRVDVQNSRAMDALEYGRIVHAEMGALMDAARHGHSVRNAVLFTTTFPCHMCAKHIVASGIAKVYYLEPYPKSLVSEIHSDSVEVDGSDRGKYRDYPASRFEHFYGVTPRRYREFFERTKRKKDGQFVPYSGVGGKPQPIVETYRPSYAQLEQKVIRFGLELLEQLTEKRAAGGRNKLKPLRLVVHSPDV